jgi:plastocyanin
MRGKFLLGGVVLVAALVFAAGTLGASAAPQAAKPKQVVAGAGGFGDLTFTPATVKAKLGGSVNWHFQTGGHTTTDTDFAGVLWDSGVRGGGTDFPRAFPVAGTYNYKCDVHESFGMIGVVQVPLTVSPKTGSPSTRFTITWASAAIPAGYAVDVQRKGPAGGYSTILSHTTTPSTMQTLAAGSYAYRARLVKLSNGKATGYSPAGKITVS